uniref:Protein-L-isoaspartate O-methyltransferase n=1 Tax=Steinernema glaseri TaxID=37863 RepID=A0A1I7YKS1_9BILA
MLNRLKQRFAATTLVSAALTMAWRSHGRTNNELVTSLRRNGVYHSERVAEVMLAVDRADFCGSNPYLDSPQSIGYNATISAPHMHASALELLLPKLVNGSHVLDVGSGSGYLTTCMAHLVGQNGVVVGIEHIPQLVNLSLVNIRKNHSQLLDSGRLKIIEGDGRLGYPADSPYEVIHVGAAADSLPQTLVDQLAVGGRMILPLNANDVRNGQRYVQVDKVSDTEIQTKDLMGVIYVPLTSVEHQIGRR